MRLARWASLTPQEKNSVRYVWDFWARPNQQPPPGVWNTWLLLAGRGFGKTRTGTEWLRMEVNAGRAPRIAVIGETAADVRDVLVEGPSGILAISPPGERPKYEPSKRRLTWPNGSVATTYSAEDPDQLRGPEHARWLGDEVAKWKNGQETIDNLMFGLRVGPNPCGVAMTTPRPVAVIRDFLKGATPAADMTPRKRANVVVTRGSTFDNRPNLPAAFLEKVISKYEGTRLGRQELYAEVLDDIEGALWTYVQIDEARVTEHPPLKRIVVAIDPAVTATEDSDETGIVVAGVGMNGEGYVLADVSGRMSPDAWARRAVKAYHDFKADRIIAEVNNGGDMVESTLRTVDKRIPYTKVHASRGKVTRAEPVAALYEQGKVHHVGLFPQLEDQMCTWTVGDASPDRVDALVWCLSDLMLGAATPPLAVSAPAVGNVAQPNWKHIR